jgi:integrase
MSGWTTRLRELVNKSGVEFTLHDCRRTFRSGLSRVGVDREIAELMLNHSRGDLVERYDREARTAARAAAADKWATLVAQIVRGDRSEHPAEGFAPAGPTSANYLE